ncbi:hypothetical protein H0H81_003936 [Sphagnurus paluster]|uniref:Uncharacterized protein n=1 Tax=Sphagnurus paluster TaxID=117069 RepID=A0A9P7GTM6_9AGAR|nr:hypothetical protein H0H81_003936 [Sphagnurus paluster]
MKLSALIFLLCVATAVVEAGPTPVKTPFKGTAARNVCTPRQPRSKYTKPIPKGKKETVMTGRTSSKAGAGAGLAVKKSGKKRSLEESSSALVPRTFTHPNAATKIRLFHGARSDIAGKVDLARASKAGDFSNKPSFYLTDREKAALQFICLDDATWYGTKEEIAAAEMYVIDYQAIHDSDMVVGPMQKPEGARRAFLISSRTPLMHVRTDVIRGVTDNFYQYVVMNQAAADARLTRIGVKKLKCDPEGQKGNFD